MKPKGINLKPFEVPAFIERGKSRFSRPVKPQPDDDGLWDDDKFPRSLQSDLKGWNGTVDATGESMRFDPRYQPGDILYGRETWRSMGFDGDQHTMLVQYKDEKNRWVKMPADYVIFCQTLWHPSQRMPIEAARIWLRVEHVKCLRVQDYSELEAIEEGAKEMHLDHLGNTWETHKRGFESQFISIYGAEPWERNVWIWSYKVEVLSTNGKPENICQ